MTPFLIVGAEYYKQWYANERDGTIVLSVSPTFHSSLVPILYSLCCYYYWLLESPYLLSLFLFVLSKSFLCCFPIIIIIAANALVVITLLIIIIVFSVVVILLLFRYCSVLFCRLVFFFTILSGVRVYVFIGTHQAPNIYILCPYFLVHTNLLFL